MPRRRVFWIFSAVLAPWLAPWVSVLCLGRGGLSDLLNVFLWPLLYLCFGMFFGTLRQPLHLLRRWDRRVIVASRRYSDWHNVSLFFLFLFHVSAAASFTSDPFPWDAILVCTLLLYAPYVLLESRSQYFLAQAEEFLHESLNWPDWRASVSHEG